MRTASRACLVFRLLESQGWLNRDIYNESMAKAKKDLDANPSTVKRHREARVARMKAANKAAEDVRARMSTDRAQLPHDSGMAAAWTWAVAEDEKAIQGKKQDEVVVSQAQARRIQAEQDEKQAKMAAKARRAGLQIQPLPVPAAIAGGLPALPGMVFASTVVPPPQLGTAPPRSSTNRSEGKRSNGSTSMDLRGDH